MRFTPKLLPLALVTASFTSLLGGCSAGGSPSAPSTGNALPSLQSIAQKPNTVDALGLNKSWITPQAKTTPLLYVSDGEENLVLIYPATGHNPAPIGQLSGFDIAAGLAVDNAGNLYVADVVNQLVKVFHRGSTTPFETLNAHGYVYGVAVDNSGNVYTAVSTTGSAQGFVGVYPPGATEPASTLTDPSRGFSPVNVAIDSHNNLFVTYDASINTAPGGINEFKAGTTKAVNLGITFPKGVGWLTIDINGNLIVPGGGGGVRVYPPGSKQPSFSFGAGMEFAPTQVALNQANSLVYVAEHGANPPVVNSVRVYTYPGAKLVNTITNGLPSGNPIDAVDGVAVDPKSPL